MTDFDEIVDALAAERDERDGLRELAQSETQRADREYQRAENAETVAEAARAEASRLSLELASRDTLIGQLRQRIADLEANPPVDPPTPTQRTLFGSCPMLPGGASLAAAQTVVTKWGKGAAVRQFLGGISSVAQRPADASITHHSWKEFTSANLTPEKVQAACVNLKAGDVVEIIHESDNDGLTGQAFDDRVALKSKFYDVVKQVRPDLLVANTVTGWLADPKSNNHADLRKWMQVKADILGIDCDGIRPTALPYTSYEDETRTALAMVEEFKGNGYRWFAVPEFGCPRITSADPDGSKRAAYHKQYADLWKSTGKCLFVTLYEYDSSPNYSLTTVAEVAQWKSLIGG